MAIVFVSPQKKQILFFALTAGFFLLLLIIVALIVFLSKPASISEEQAFKKPNINVDFSVLDSDELKALVPLDPMQYDYIYQASTETGRPVTGIISAISDDDAKAKVSDLKLFNIIVQKNPGGRDNPFNVYYQQQVVAPNKTK